VDRKSATLGLPGTRERQIAMDTDHSHICKFERDDDDTYEQVADNMVELIANAVQAVADRERLTKSRVLHSNPSLESREHACT
jgi:hypothetical protein